MLLAEKTNNSTSEMPYLDKLSEEFRNANWKSVDGQLWVGKSLQVSNWEASVQIKAAKLLSVLNVNKVLEIGYGLEVTRGQSC